MKVRLTKRVVEAATLSQGARSLELWDIDLKGFGILVRGAEGEVTSRTYLVRYGTGQRGKGRTLRIGPHGGPWRPDPVTGGARVLTVDLAREEAQRLLGLRAAGEDPAAARAAARVIPTFAAFSAQYLRDWVSVEKAPASREKDEGNLRLHLLPALGQYRLDRVGPDLVARLKVSMKATPVAANRCLALLSHMIRMARVWRVLPAGHPNPCADVPRYEEIRRERPLQEDELPRVGQALVAAEAAWSRPRSERRAGMAVSPTAACAIRTLLFTGARPVELLGLRRDEGLEAALAAGVLERPSRKVGRRRRRVRLVVLPSVAVAELRAAPARPGNPYVFPGRDRDGEPRPLSIFALDDAWARIRRAAGLPDDVRLYDASRHTYGTTTVGDGSYLAHAQRLLGHSSIVTTERYVHLPEDPIRAAAERTGQRLADALAGRLKSAT